MGISLRWNGNDGVASHDGVAVRLLDPFQMPGLHVQEIDYYSRIDDRGQERRYARLKEIGKPWRDLTEEECAQVLMRLGQMSAGAMIGLAAKLPRRMRRREQVALMALLERWLAWSDKGIKRIMRRP